MNKHWRDRKRTAAACGSRWNPASLLVLHSPEYVEQFWIWNSDAHTGIHFKYSLKIHPIALPAHTNRNFAGCWPLWVIRPQFDMLNPYCIRISEVWAQWSVEFAREQCKGRGFFHSTSLWMYCNMKIAQMIESSEDSVALCHAFLCWLLSSSARRTQLAAWKAHCSKVKTTSRKYRMHGTRLLVSHLGREQWVERCGYLYSWVHTTRKMTVRVSRFKATCACFHPSSLKSSPKSCTEMVSAKLFSSASTESATQTSSKTTAPLWNAGVFTNYILYKSMYQR